MKTLVCSLAAAVAVTVSGCWPHLPHTIVQDPSPPAAVKTRPSRPPVTPEQVTPGNARRIAEELWDEVDREQTSSLRSPVKEPSPK